MTKSSIVAEETALNVKEKVYVNVRLYQAKNLVSADPVFAGGKSDPFVLFRIGKTKKKSSTILDNLNPVWIPSEDFTFEVPKGEFYKGKAILYVKVFDWDRFNQDDLIGTTSIPLYLPVCEIENNEKNEKPDMDEFDLTIPDEYLHQKEENNAEPSKLCLSMKVLTEEQHNSHIVLSLWEKERWVIGSGWGGSNLIAGDGGHWESNGDKIFSSESFSDVAPKTPDGFECDDWGYSTEQGDAVGWSYAVSFTGPWHKSNSPLMFVRRRKWENNCRKIEV